MKDFNYDSVTMQTNLIHFFINFLKEWFNKNLWLHLPTFNDDSLAQLVRATDS